MAQKLYPTAKRILKILWVNDDLILQEDLEKLQAEVKKLSGVWKKYPETATLKAMVQDADDSMDQDALFKLQEVAINLAESVATDEDRISDLVRSFPYLFSWTEGDI